MLIYLIVLSASYFHKDVLLLAVGGRGDHGSNDGKMYAATRSLIVENNKIYAEIFHSCFSFSMQSEETDIITLEYACSSVSACVTKRHRLIHYPLTNALSNHRTIAWVTAGRLNFYLLYLLIFLETSGPDDIFCLVLVCLAVLRQLNRFPCFRYPPETDKYIQETTYREKKHLSLHTPAKTLFGPHVHWGTTT